MTVQEKMKIILLDAYLHPDRKDCFYSADSEQTNNPRLDHLPVWDWTPQRSLQVEGNSTCIFPLAFGCKRIITRDGTEWAEPLFDEQTLLNSSEFNIDVPDVWSGKTGELLQSIKQMVVSLGNDELIRAVDIQSPLGVAEVICGSGLYMALLTNPGPVHELLQKITGFIIKFINEMRNIAGEKLNGAMFPFIWNNHHGTLCSDDTLSLLSPENHQQFSLPYVVRIAETCGPLFYHSCSWREDYFDNIKKVPNVRAYNWNTGNSTDPKIIIEAFSGKAVLAPHICADMHLAEAIKKWGRFQDESELLEYVLNCMQDNTCLYLWIGEMGSKPHVLEKMYDILHKRGYSPESKGLI